MVSIYRSARGSLLSNEKRRTKIVKAKLRRKNLVTKRINRVMIDHFSPPLAFFFFSSSFPPFNSPILTFNAWRFPLLHPLHSRYIFYCQYQRLPGVGPTHGILYFVTLMARLDTILHSGNDVSSASSIDEISLSGISFPLCIEGHTTGFHKGVTGIARPGWKNRVGTNKKIACFVRMLPRARQQVTGWN